MTTFGIATLIISPLFAIFIYLFVELDLDILENCKLKIVEEVNRKGDVKYIIYKKRYFLSFRTYKEFNNYENAFDFVVNNESERLERIEEKRNKKIVSKRTRLNIK